VAKLARELVATNEQGKQFSAFYERVNPMLLNEFIKEHREKQDQQAIIEKQASKI
jgi:lauroyl/myristoyl acyltransferase